MPANQCENVLQLEYILKMYQKDINECCSKLHYCIMSQFPIENIYFKHEEVSPLTDMGQEASMLFEAVNAVGKKSR